MSERLLNVIKREVQYKSEKVVPKGSDYALGFINNHAKELADLNGSELLSLSKYLRDIATNTPLTSIDLTDDQFEEFENPKVPYLVHKRCQDILKMKDTGKIINGRAWGYNVRRVYNDDTCEEVKAVGNIYVEKVDHIFPFYLDVDHLNDTIKLYFSKGGIVDGTYIDLCEVHSEDKYLIRDAINIPVSIIYKEGVLDNYLIVDSREPKLHALMSFYNCEIKRDDTRFNIRKYKKLN